MVYTHTFTTTSGFATTNNLSLIQNDIVQQINTTLLNIKSVGDCIETQFQTPLSNDELQLLQNIITSRDTFIDKHYLKTYYPDINNVSNTDYQTLGNFSFKGTKLTGDIRGFDMISYMDTGITSYTIQIINRNNNSIVCEQTFTNTASQMNTTASVLTQPYDSCILQVSMKNIQPISLVKLYSHLEEINIFI